MGLIVETKYGTPVVHHGGDMIGFHSDMMWLPEHNVGAVVLTNADPGWMLRDNFQRKLLEVLFEGRPEADADLAAGAKSYFDQLAAERKLFTVPAAAEDATQARGALRERRARHDRRGPRRRGHRLRLRGVEERGRFAAQPRRDRFVPHHHARNHRVRVRGGLGRAAEPGGPGRPARVRLCGDGPELALTLRRGPSDAIPAALPAVRRPGTAGSADRNSAGVRGCPAGSPRNRGGAPGGRSPGWRFCPGRRP